MALTILAAAAAQLCDSVPAEVAATGISYVTKNHGKKVYGHASNRVK
jgi:hypothetical protein